MTRTLTVQFQAAQFTLQYSPTSGTVADRLPDAKSGFWLSKAHTSWAKSGVRKSVIAVVHPNTLRVLPFPYS
jgi:hypothetical protein